MINKEPDNLNEILALRVKHTPLNKKVDNLRNRIKGALFGRFAGCILGIPVEGKPLDYNLDLAKRTGTSYPPITYWKGIDEPDNIQYGVCPRRQYTDGNIKEVPVDDDITYTILNMALLEKYGLDYSLDDVASFWLDVLPYACTAEDTALTNLKKGVPVREVKTDPVVVEWIGAAIRADAFGYAKAGRPEEAAKLAYNDAFLTHVKNGIYGEMFIAATIAAAFVTKTPLDALKEGMKEIPQESKLYQDLVWALSYEGKLKDYKEARALLDEHFVGMHWVHTIINMCAIAFSLILGGNDFTKCISECVAIGLDNDCTGATVGSIVGANIGIENIDPYWYKDFNDTVRTYIKGYEKLSLEDVVDRFVKLSESK